MGREGREPREACWPAVWTEVSDLVRKGSGNSCKGGVGFHGDTGYEVAARDTAVQTGSHVSWGGRDNIFAKRWTEGIISGTGVTQPLTEWHRY